jgi:hypothetical protein
VLMYSVFTFAAFSAFPVLLGLRISDFSQVILHGR